MASDPSTRADTEHADTIRRSHDRFHQQTPHQAARDVDRQRSSHFLPLYVDGESSVVAAEGARDQVMFTNKRVFTVNVQGITGSKVDITSLPYSRVQAFSIDSGTFDRDCELETYFSGLGIDQASL